MKSSTLATVLRWGIYLVVLVPLIIFRDYISPFHFGKVILFRSLVEVLLVGYLLLIWHDSSYLPKRTPIFWAFMGFTLAFSLTTLTSIAPHVSFWGTLERMGGLWTFWHYFLFFVIATSVLRERQHWQRLLELSIATSIISALYGLGQRTDIGFFIGSGGRERIFGTIGNPALFAGYEIIHFFLALTFLLLPNLTSGRRIFFGSAAFLSGLAIVLTVVRGSLLALVVGLVVFVGLYYLRFRARLARKGLLLLAAGALLFFIVVVSPLRTGSFIEGSRFLTRVTDVSLNTFTVKTRFWAWEAGIQGWKESPKTILLGWGPENFNIPFSRHFNPRFFNGFGSETFFDRAHNMFVEVLVTMGLIGLVAYVGMLGSFLWMLKKIYQEGDPEDQIYSIGCGALIVAYSIHNSFIFDTSPNFIAIFMVFGFISFLYHRRSGSSLAVLRGVSSVQIGTKAMIAALVGWVVVGGVIYKTAIVSAQANYATTRAVVLGWAGDFDGALAKFKEAVAYATPQGLYEYRHRLAQFLIEKTNKPAPYSATEIAALRYGIREVQKNADENPRDYLPLLYLSHMNFVLGKEGPTSPYNDVALGYAFQALDLSPTFIRTHYEIAQIYLNKKDFVSAREYYQRALTLNPSVAASYWYVGIVDIAAGTLEKNSEQLHRGLSETDEALDRGYTASDTDLLRLVDAYLRLNDYRKITQLYERIVKVAPKNPAHWSALAFAYARIERIDDAIAAARTAATLDQSYLVPAREFARSLGRDLGI